MWVHAVECWCIFMVSLKEHWTSIAIVVKSFKKIYYSNGSYLSTDSTYTSYMHDKIQQMRNLCRFFCWLFCHRFAKAINFINCEKWAEQKISLNGIRKVKAHKKKRTKLTILLKVCWSMTHYKSYWLINCVHEIIFFLPSKKRKKNNTKKGGSVHCHMIVVVKIK